MGSPMKHASLYMFGQGWLGVTPTQERDEGQSAGLRSRAPTLNFFNVTRRIEPSTVGVDPLPSATASVLMGRAIASGWQGPPDFSERGRPHLISAIRRSMRPERASVSKPHNRHLVRSLNCSTTANFQTRRFQIWIGVFVGRNIATAGAGASVPSLFIQDPSAHQSQFTYDWPSNSWSRWTCSLMLAGSSGSVLLRY